MRFDLQSTRESGDDGEAGFEKAMSPLWIGLACGSMLAATAAVAAAHMWSGPVGEVAVATSSTPQQAVAAPVVPQAAAPEAVTPSLPAAVPSSPIQGSVSPSTKWVKTFTVPASAVEKIETTTAHPAPPAIPPRVEEGPATVASIAPDQASRPVGGDAAGADGANQATSPSVVDEAEPRTVSLAVPPNVRVRERNTFQIGSDLYKLTSLEGLGIPRCNRKTSRRCTNHPRSDLRDAIAGATLDCTVHDETGNVHSVTCDRTGAAKVGARSGSTSASKSASMPGERRRARSARRSADRAVAARPAGDLVRSVAGAKPTRVADGAEASATASESAGLVGAPAAAKPPVKLRRSQIRKLF